MLGTVGVFVCLVLGFYFFVRNCHSLFIPFRGMVVCCSVFVGDIVK